MAGKGGDTKASFWEFVMAVADVVVLAASVAAIGVLGWFFFAPLKAHTALLEGGVQRVEVTVRPVVSSLKKPGCDEVFRDRTTPAAPPPGGAAAA